MYHPDYPRKYATGSANNLNNILIFIFIISSFIIELITILYVPILF